MDHSDRKGKSPLGELLLGETKTIVTDRGDIVPSKPMLGFS